MPYFNYNDKNIYYNEIGQGVPLFLLHGNSVSLKMFDIVLDLYKNNFKMILINFLGHGRSNRLKEFTTDFWYDEALQVISFMNSKNYQRANIIGTSGGALAALNIALERPDLVNCVIADSFEGEKSVESFAGNV